MSAKRNDATGLLREYARREAYELIFAAKARNSEARAVAIQNAQHWHGLANNKQERAK